MKIPIKDKELKIFEALSFSGCMAKSHLKELDLDISNKEILNIISSCNAELQKGRIIESKNSIVIPELQYIEEILR